MSGIRYPEEFKIEAVKQVTDRGYKIGEVAKRLGVTPKSMHDCNLWGQSQVPESADSA